MKPNLYFTQDALWVVITLLWHKTKQMISEKKKAHVNKLRDSVFEKPKRFWSFIKTSTKIIQQQ